MLINLVCDYIGKYAVRWKGIVLEIRTAKPLH